MKPPNGATAARAHIPLLDATRGVLACVVAGAHWSSLTGNSWTGNLAVLAVLVFFIMSGYVLARAYDGDAATFCLRRVVRLWPTYAVALFAAHGLGGALPSTAELAWLPSGVRPSMAVDGPTWSLYAEAWATLMFPLAFAVPGRALPVIVALASCGLVAWWPVMFPLPMFLAGVAAARFAIPWPDRPPAPLLLWLGKISFSLYLTHWIVLAALGRWGVLLVLPVAWLTWWAVERPSIRWSRRVRLPTRPALLKYGA
jgi:peptidoglycan/LPS O-acetylase OafA/YrhL